MAIQIYDMGVDFTKGERTHESISDFRHKKAQANQANATADKYRADVAAAKAAAAKAASLQAKRGELLRLSGELKDENGNPASELEKLIHFRGSLAGIGDTEAYAEASKSILEHRTGIANKQKADEEKTEALQKRYSPKFADLERDPSNENIERHMEDLTVTDPAAAQRLREMYEANPDMPLEERSKRFGEMVHKEYRELKHKQNKKISIDTNGSIVRVPENQEGIFPKTLSAKDQHDIDNPKPSAFHYITNEQGDVTVLQGENVVRTIKGAGKPSATHEKSIKSVEDMERKLDELIPELERITADGGLIDKSTGSGLGHLYDLAASLIGHATEGAIAIGRLQPIWDMALKMIPRFEGPQSNKDVKTYREAAADLANPLTPNDRRKEAGKELLRLLKERRGQFTTIEVEASGGRRNPVRELQDKRKGGIYTPSGAAEALKRRNS